MERRNRDRLAPVEADKGRVDQLAHFHHRRQAGFVGAGTPPEFGAGGGRQNGLNIDALGIEFEGEAL